MRRALIALFLSAMTITNTHAQSIEGVNDDTSYGKWGFSGYVGGASIDSDTAFIEGVDEGALSFGLFVDYRKDSWITSIGVDVLSYDDNQEFSQVVVGDGLFNSGDVSTESSDATATFLTVASGYEKLFGENETFYANIQTGFSLPVISERSIDNCENCYSEDIDVDGGLFAQGSAGINTEKFSIGLQVRQYLSGDGLTNNVAIIVASRF